MTFVLLQTASNETLKNASMANSFGSTGGLLEPLLLVVWTVIVISVLSAARSNEYFQHLIDALGWVAVSFMYALHGVAALVIAAVLAAPAYLIATSDPGTRTMVAEYAGIAVGAYLAVALVGYAAKHYVFDPIRANIDEHVDTSTVDSGVDAD